MSLKFKTETAFNTVIIASGIGPMTGFLSQNNQKVTQDLPCYIIEWRPSDNPTARTLQERANVLVTVKASANQDTIESPEGLQRSNVDLISDALKTISLKATLNATGPTGWHCLFARYLGEHEVEPEEGMFVESFAWDIVAMEQTVS